MRALLSAFAAISMLLPGSHGSGRAGLEPGPAGAPALEVVIFEHTDCVYCRVFRREVLPRYHEAVQGGVAPLRFVDIATGDAASLGLSARIDTVPTTVVVRDGREVDRIVGYWGPANFFALLSRILTRMD